MVKHTEKNLTPFEALHKMREGKIVYPSFLGIELRYYKIVDEKIYYSDDLVTWNKSRLKTENFTKQANGYFVVLK